ncbi:carbamate kinase [Photobacterium sp. ZSDE20]|uniref:Carbamate kinase n=1 Tax=Photobacterium pectinilyticum TaxID=2906793 RepID=A0ABT1N9F7_9GAMM|nr:carbamate kinase [Photobacterium sp. ZSDE20]MCQ1060747.1 carbamate kinase [Photobacterium sp. ZSDE20]MDD1828317.1 carbamate kinase [Photobacterium sp. ZSDE20]
MNKKRIVIALGGNAMLKRGEVLSAENQQHNIDKATVLIKQLDQDYDVIIVHGNGPQVGLLALQNSAYNEVPAYPLDNLVAQTQGMLGYMLMHSLTEQGMSDVSCLLTRVEVSASDPAFAAPTKYIGPVYSPQDRTKLEKQHGWKMKPDGQYIRRVVASPKPVQVIEADTIVSLLDQGKTVVCCGGGGVPVVQQDVGYRGVEAVIDKDAVAAMLAEQIGADYLMILTDADAVYQDWGTPNQKALKDVTVSQMRPFAAPDGAMGPKAEAVIQFVERTGQIAFIGALQDVEQILVGEKGTCVRPACTVAPEDVLVS